MYSQIGQDYIASSLLKEKKNGTFVDLGCAGPIWINNTYLLEKEFNWKGISIDINSGIPNLWNQERPNSTLIITDATLINFSKMFEENNLPKRIDYLSLDLDPPEATFESLKKIPLDEYSFNVITFEHDAYRMGIDFRESTREYISSFGYQLVFNLYDQDDVYINQSMKIPSIKDRGLIIKNIKTQPQPYDPWDWKRDEKGSVPDDIKIQSSRPVRKKIY